MGRLALSTAVVEGAVRCMGGHDIDRGIISEHKNRLLGHDAVSG